MRGEAGRHTGDARRPGHRLAQRADVVPAFTARLGGNAARAASAPRPLTAVPNAAGGGSGRSRAGGCRADVVDNCAELDAHLSRALAGEKKPRADVSARPEPRYHVTFAIRQWARNQGQAGILLAFPLYAIAQQVAEPSGRTWPIFSWLESALERHALRQRITEIVICKHRHSEKLTNTRSSPGGEGGGRETRWKQRESLRGKRRWQERKARGSKGKSRKRR